MGISWAVTVGAVCGALVQVIKTGKAASLLAHIGVPPVVGVWLPRVAILLGAVIGVTEVLVAGGNVAACVIAAVNGAMAGALPVALHEAVRKA